MSERSNSHRDALAASATLSIRACTISISRLLCWAERATECIGPWINAVAWLEWAGECLVRWLGCPSRYGYGY